MNRMRLRVHVTYKYIHMTGSKKKDCRNWMCQAHFSLKRKVWIEAFVEGVAEAQKRE